MIIKTFLDRLANRAELKQRLESYTVSAIFHILLLFVLATITVSTGSDTFGFHLRSKGAQVRLAFREEQITDAQLEDVIEEPEIKPMPVERLKMRRMELPELASFSSPRPSSERLAKINTRFSPASNLGDLSTQFGSFIVGLRKSGLDIALVVDASASMQHVIDDIKAKALSLVGSIQELVPVARVGVVAFRDRGEEFVVKWTDLSFHASKIEAFVRNLDADGGGDYEEGVRQGLEAAMDELSWRRRAKRVIIIVGSSPPHKEDIPALAALAKEFRDTNGVISAIDVTKRMHERYERDFHIHRYGKPPDEYSPLPAFYLDVRDNFRMIADNGGGELASLGTDAQLTEQILYFAFGSRWQKEVARYGSVK